jgi:hypothetical protein
VLQTKYRNRHAADGKPRFGEQVLEVVMAGQLGQSLQTALCFFSLEQQASMTSMSPFCPALNDIPSESGHWLRHVKINASGKYNRTGELKKRTGPTM